MSQADDRPEASYRPIALHDRLPVIPVPLRPPHADAQLDLQAVLQRVHQAAGYTFYIYEEGPLAGFSPEEEAWARALILGEGRGEAG